MNPQPTPGIDATKKLPAKGFKRAWLPLIPLDAGDADKFDALELPG